MGPPYTIRERMLARLYGPPRSASSSLLPTIWGKMVLAWRLSLIRVSQWLSQSSSRNEISGDRLKPAPELPNWILVFAQEQPRVRRPLQSYHVASFMLQRYGPCCAWPHNFRAMDLHGCLPHLDIRNRRVYHPRADATRQQRHFYHNTARFP